MLFIGADAWKQPNHLTDGFFTSDTRHWLKARNPTSQGIKPSDRIIPHVYRKMA
jgi:hypothetical protein